MEAASQFSRAMSDRGITAQNIIPADGDLHRFHIEGDTRGSKNGWAVLHDDGVAAGAFGSWKHGVTHTWHQEGPLSRRAQQEWKRQIASAAAKRDGETVRRQVEAQERATKIWAEAQPASDDHPYLIKKGVKAHGLRESRGNLVVPLRDIKGKLHSLQFIHPDGGKRFLSGGRTTGCYLAIGKPDNRILISEGYATGATLHAATGEAVGVAFNAGNLKPVAEALRGKFLETHITLCADNDTKTDGNPGVTKATEAAAAIDASVVIPDAHGDFNDLAISSGLGAVSEALRECAPVPPPDQRESYTIGAPGGEFLVSDSGIYFEDTEKNSKTFIASRIDVLALSRDNANEAWGRLMVFDDPEGIHHKWCLPMSMLAGDGVDMRRELMGQGVKVGGSKRARDLLSTYIQNADPKKYARAVLKTGWDNAGNYVLPNQVIGIGSSELVYLQSINSAAGRWYTSSGDLAGWQTHVANKCPGNSRLMLSVCAAFAAPVLERLNAESGGLHIFGTSSQGKTTTLIAGISVWGPPEERIQSWRATVNGLEGTAAAHNDSLLVLDEISQADPHQVGEAAYMLGNQTGKSRAQRNGALRVPVRWRLLFLSSGEQSMQTYLRQAGQKLNAGQLVRFVDIPAAPSGADYGLFETVHGASGSNSVLQGQAFADAIINGAKRFYGTAGIAFVQRLVTEGRSERLRCYMDQFKAENAPDNSSGQVLRVLERFAMIAAAGELASEWGITGWQVGAASQGIGCCFQDWVSTRGGSGLHEDDQLIESVTDFLQRYGGSRFQDWNGDERAHKPNDRAGYRKSAADGSCDFYVFPNVFKTEICKGYEPKKAGKLLAEAGMLEKEGRGYICSRRAPGSQKSSRWYILRLPEITQQTRHDDAVSGALKVNERKGYPTNPTNPTSGIAAPSATDSSRENRSHDSPVGYVGQVGYANDGRGLGLPDSDPTAGESQAKTRAGGDSCGRSLKQWEVSV